MRRPPFQLPLPDAFRRRPWLYLLLSSFAGTFLLFTRLPWLVVPVQALLPWLVLGQDLREGRPWRGARHMLGWALFTSIWTIAFTQLFPEAAAASIVRGPGYREEMFTFIRTGAGPEGDPRLFVPEHVLHYAGTMVLSFLTAGFAGLALGVVLMNYMNFYVGELVRVGARPAVGLLFGWPVWSVLRVIGFVFGAVALAHLFTSRVLRRTPYDRAANRLLLLSVGLVLADMVVKAFLAPAWRTLLRRALLP